MDIYSAVECVRSYKGKVAADIELASALHEIRAIRTRKERAWKRHDELIDKVNSYHLVSGAYGSTVSVQTSRNHSAIAEMLEEASDLSREVCNDIALLNDAIDLVEDAVQAIPDKDTREIIDAKYLKGWSDTEIEEMYKYRQPGYAQRLEGRYFRSLSGDPAE